MTYILQQKEGLDQSNEFASKGLNMLPRLPERPLRDKIYSLLQKHALQATLLDPETDIDTLVHKAELTVEQGTDLLFMGGSSHVSPVMFFKGMEAVKKVIKNVPLIIYNANFEMISDAADGMLYGSVLNSKDLFYVVNNSINAAPLFRKVNVEPLASAFLF